MHKVKSTFSANLVVPFHSLLCYTDIVIKIPYGNKQEVFNMNTDKILAESIAKDYVSKGSSKIVALKKLDRKAKLPATIFTYTLGIISSLIAGTGMCIAMQVIGSGTGAVVAGIRAFGNIILSIETSLSVK